MNWVITIGGIIALIVLHELGHFAVAKAVGMRVERFSLFFPPKLIGFKRGETEYMVGAIPAGGYVKITGMSPEEVEELEPEVARRAYYNQAPWKRIAVILAGPGVNLIITFVLFWVVLASGVLDGVVTMNNLDPGLNAVTSAVTVGVIEKGAPAEGVLREDDRILKVDGRPASMESVRDVIASHRCAGKPTAGCRAVTPATLLLRRGGKDVQVSVTPEYNAKAGRMLLGFIFGFSARSMTPLQAASGSLRTMWVTTEETITGLGEAITNSKRREELKSVVGITEVTEQAVAAGAGRGLVVIGFVSLILAVINLFPFLPLDGGHVLWSVAEKLRGRRISAIAMWRFSSVGIVLLLFFVVNGFSNDIHRLTG
ncbi:MAG TPA: M50 family metallopeptidase [Solirubrobacteraceae bacterium]|jgi:regulator of sigma E protease